jgi:hypothetical protein
LDDAMHAFHPHQYGPVLAPLVGGERCRALDHGSPDPALRAALELATVDAAFAHAPLADRDLAACCLAGMWLVHDFLEESHSISQDADTPSGSFWHGVMHRREGDYSNAKYWFRRVGPHPVLDELSIQAPELSGGFDPFTFVDRCQAASRSGGTDADACRRLQQLEWELLFDFCYRRAVAL